MDDPLISQFIDDELGLEEKIQFVNAVHGNDAFTSETLAYLEQEKLVQTELEPWQPAHVDLEVQRVPWLEYVRSWWQPVAGFAAAMVLVVFVSVGIQDRFQQKVVEVREVPVEREAVNYRFVLFQEAKKVEIVGSFTNWQKVPLVPTGAGSYWEITLPVSRGEHKYSFVVDGEELLPDPTVAAREPDDFGAVNSIIRVEA